MRILLVEDATRLRQGLCSALKRTGYCVDTAADGEEGLWSAQSNAYDTIILDIMLPKLSGLEILHQLRTGGNEVPILLLTAKDTIPDRVTGLRAGADDYLIKPFDLEEMLARVEALCRRAYRSTHNVVTIGTLTVNTTSRKAAVSGNEVRLTSREFALLEYLARRRGEIVSRNEIEAHIYDDQVEPMSNVVDSAIYALRKKLVEAGVPALIHTRRGLGYILETADREPAQ